MLLHARALVNQQTLADFLGQKFDEEIPEGEDSLTHVINSVTLEIEKRLGRTFINTDPRTELLSGSNRPYIYTINSPAVSITTFKIRTVGNTFTLVSTAWIINSEHADDVTLYEISTKLYSPNGEIFARGVKNYEIVYVPAWKSRGNLPENLIHGAMQLMSLRLKQKERRLVGVTSVSFDDEQQSIGFDWPRDIEDLLAPFSNNAL